MSFCSSIWKFTWFLFSLEITRTENSIKNYWNCTLKQKLRSYSACGFDLYSYSKKAECRKSEVDKQSFDQNLNLERSTEACSLDFVLGNANGRNSQFEALDKENCKSPPRKEGNDSGKGTVGTIENRAPASCGLISEECRESAMSANTTEYTDHISIDQGSKLHNISFGNLMRFQNSCEKTPEPANSINSLPSKALSMP